MTHEQKIEALSNEIRKALPYLKNIEVGQIFFNKKSGYLIANEVRNITISGKNSDEERYLISGLTLDNAFKSFFYPISLELIGKEPLLNDVLAWLDKLNICYYVSETGHIYDGFITSSLSKWNLEKPYLKDQSVELIDFLYSLIEK